VQVVMADPTGFCPGVRAAVDRALATAHGGTVYCLGELVHNRAVGERLRRAGIRAVEDAAQVPRGGVLLLPSHGAPPEVYEKAASLGLTLVDATCAWVRRAQRAVAGLAKRGLKVIILGDRRHTEVRGLVGWTGGTAEVVSDPEEVDELELPQTVGLAAQTTETAARARAVADRLRQRGISVDHVDTLCPETQRRQEAVVRLADVAELVVVIGGRNSANTRKLALICRERGVPTHLVESPEEVRSEWWRGRARVGLAAGASTPGWVIKEVLSKMEESKDLSLEQDIEPEKELEESTESAAEPVETSDADEAPAVEAEAEAEAESEAEEAPAVEAEAETAAEPEAEEAPAVEAEAETAAEPEAEEAPAVEAEPEAEEAPAVEAEAETAAEPAAAPEEPADDEVVRGEDLASPQLKPGDVVEGTVVALGSDNVLVDVGHKSEGVIPLWELDVRHVASPAEVVSVGDRINVYVLAVDGPEGVLRLSKKRADEEIAWRRIEKAFDEGAVLTGTVTEEVKGGLIVDIGIRGFMPASHVERGYVSDLSVYVGREVRCRAIEIDRHKNRVILSQKVVLEEEFQHEREHTWATIKEDEVRRGVVKSITDFGAFVDVGAVDGLLHVSEMSWGRVNHPSEVVSEGDEIDVMVLRVDREKEKISLGLKQTLPDPWENVEEKYPVGSLVKGKVVRIVGFGAFVELEPGVEGLVHISQLANRRVATPEEAVSVGAEIRVKVLRVNPKDRRISLSLKEAERDREKAMMREYMAQEQDRGTVTLGEMVGDLLKDIGGKEEEPTADSDGERAETGGDDED